MQGGGQVGVAVAAGVVDGRDQRDLAPARQELEIIIIKLTMAKQQVRKMLHEQ